MTKTSTEANADIDKTPEDTKAKKTRAQWSTVTELQLLRQTAKHNLFTAPYGTATAQWQVIADTLTVAGGVTWTGCRAKMLKLLEKHDQEAAKALIDTGVTYNEDGTLNDKHENVRLLYDINRSSISCKFD